MVEKEPIKTKLSTAIYFFIILLLIIGIAYLAVQNNKLEDRILNGNQTVQNVTEESKVIENITNNNASDEVKVEENKVEDNKVESNNNEEETNNISNTDLYDSVIDEYKKAMKDTSLDDDTDKINEKYPNVNGIQIMYYHTYKGEGFKYAFYDIDKNGTEELIVVNQDRDSIIDIFTHDGNKVLKLIDEPTLGDRSNMDIWDNGVLFINGSGGANNGVYEFYKIASNGFSSELLGEYYYEYNDAGEVTFYKDLEQKEKLNYTSVKQIEKEHLSNAKVVSMSSLSWNNIYKNEI